MKSVLTSFFLLSFITALLCASFLSFGYDRTWGFWNIPTMTPHFADLRTITHGAETYRSGLDPMLENTEDPWQRPLNYPRIWQILFLSGLNRSHTTILGIIVIGLFFLGICLSLYQAGTAAILLTMLAVISPATMLGIERANSDLLIFFILATGIFASNRSQMILAASIFGATVFKLYPAVAIFSLINEKKSDFKKFFLGTATLIAIYFLYISADIAIISKNTPAGTHLSYGFNVFWMEFFKINYQLGSVTRLLSHVFLLGILLQTIKKTTANNDNRLDNTTLTSFRAGASIYIGTFLIGNNWDYRLIFLILTIPFLAGLFQQSGRQNKFLSSITLFSIFLSMWSLLLNDIPFLNKNRLIMFIIDETGNWLIFFGLLQILVISLPVWTKNILNTQLSSHKTRIDDNHA